jgi:putative nucleotidyltransferase with HDIG domain
MALLERLGLTPKPGRYSRRAGLRKDGRAPLPDGHTLSRRGLVERLALLAALTALAVSAFSNVPVYDGSAEVGEVWRSDDVVAPFDFAIRLPEDEVEAQRDSVRRSLPPIFAERPEAIPQTLARLDSLDARLDSTFAAYAGWQTARTRIGQAREAGADAPAALVREARADSARYAAFREGTDLGLTDDQWAALLRSARTAAAARAYGTALDDRLLGEAARIAREALARGVLDVPLDSVETPTLLVRNLDPAVRTEEERDRADVVGADAAVARARRSLRAAFPGRADLVEVGAVFFEEALVPSLAYQAAATERARAEVVEAILPTRGRVQENQTIIRRGDAVTAEQFEQLRSLVLEQAERSGGVSWGRTVLGRTILSLAALALFFLYLYLLRPAIFFDTRRLVLVCLLVGLTLVGFLIAGAFRGAAPFVVPVGLSAILLTIVFDSRVGSFAVMTLAALGGLIVGYDFPFTFATLIVGVLAVFSVRDVKNRSRILASAALVFAAYALVLVGYALLRADPFTERLLLEVVAVAVNAALVLLAGPLLWAIERTFRVTTDMTLLELSDTNREVLKKLSLQAPGTFNHSLQVANLAEAAADAVGANALRTRVGALYHDIGKMLKPEYFIENQQPGENPHEKIKPSMSALVIAAHVKDGVRLGKEQGLPQVVLDFIGSHHGTGLIEFFYRRAQEQAPEGTEVDEADYRYPGPLPQTNEEAIVMLADSVEAASRSLEKPTPKRLEALINGIVSARVADGQLDESSLTFVDLTRIKETFHTLLCGIYHFRVKYPDQDDEPAPGGDGAANGAPGGAEEIDGAQPTSEERSTLG